MKKIYIVVAVVLLAAVVWALQDIAPIDREGKRVDPGQLHTPTIRWTTIDTTVNATAASDLGVGERTYQLVKTAIANDVGNDGEIAVFDIPRSWNGIRLRALAQTEVVITYCIYLGTLGDGNRDVDSTTANCNLAYVGEFAFTIGTQVSIVSTYELAESLTVTSSDWTKTIRVSSPGSNRVAEARFDLMGADILIAVPTAVNDDCYLIAKGF